MPLEEADVAPQRRRAGAARRSTCRRCRANRGASAERAAAARAAAAGAWHRGASHWSAEGALGPPSVSPWRVVRSSSSPRSSAESRPRVERGSASCRRRMTAEIDAMSHSLQAMGARLGERGHAHRCRRRCGSLASRHPHGAPQGAARTSARRPWRCGSRLREISPAAADAASGGRHRRSPNERSSAAMCPSAPARGASPRDRGARRGAPRVASRRTHRDPRACEYAR